MSSDKEQSKLSMKLHFLNIFSWKEIGKLTIILLIGAIILGGSGCKSQKKLREKQAAEKAEQDRLAREKAEAEERERLKREGEASKTTETTETRIENYFNAIASSGSVNSANSSINEVLGLFSSQDVPVLIIISEEGETKDYDKPTTIRKYLDYLKDQKKSPDRIANLVYDDNGKIKEMELRKKE